MEHWVLVAHAAEGAVYETDELFTSFAPVLVRPNHQVHARADELGPRGSTRAGPGGERSAFERHTDPEDAERARFARELVEDLQYGLEGGDYERLVIVAPPKLLGDLRAQLTPGVAARLVASIPRDLAHTALEELPEVVRTLVADLDPRWGGPAGQWVMRPDSVS